MCYVLCIRIPGGQTISGGDIQDIVDTFTLAQLSDVYPRLGITNQDVQITLQIDNVPQQKAKKVLYSWWDKNKDNATRKKMIDAIKKVKKCNRSRSKLEEKWGITGKRNDCVMYQMSIGILYNRSIRPFVIFEHLHDYRTR